MKTRVVRWNPMREMMTMQNMMDRLMEDNWRGLSEVGAALALDVHEGDASYTVKADLPGINPDDINITIHDGSLIISGEISRTETQENERLLLNERSYGKFRRSINLPDAIDTTGVVAEYNDGVLTLNLPKLPEAQPRQIEVKVNRVLENGSQN